MNGSTSLTESVDIVQCCESLMQMLLALCAAAFQDVFTRFLALFDVVQHHNKFVKSLMEIPHEMPNLSTQATARQLRLFGPVSAQLILTSSARALNS